MIFFAYVPKHRALAPIDSQSTLDLFRPTAMADVRASLKGEGAHRTADFCTDCLQAPDFCTGPVNDCGVLVRVDDRD